MREREVNDMSDKDALCKEQWGAIYNKDMYEQVVGAIMRDEVFCWTEELLNISKEGDKLCEVGCGSGQSAAYLQKYGRDVTALDYSEESVALVKAVNETLNLGMNVVCADATEPLPFGEKEFDYIYQCGLLEHFQGDARINLLKNWSRYTKHMISMIPNASSIAYRTGKAILEKHNLWQFGLELPQYSLSSEFEQAGITNIREYTIGAEHALMFLPDGHYLKIAMQKWLTECRELGIEDLCGQGYLLVTIGDCC